MNIDELSALFFKDLKSYNTTCFKNLQAEEDRMTSPTVLKAYSSVITRYFIFEERHPELTPSECRILYYKLKIDMITKFFYEYPEIHIEYLNEFKAELYEYLDKKKLQQEKELVV